MLRPAAVDAVAAGDAVRDRESETRLSEQFEKSRLELAERYRHFAVEHSFELGAAASIGKAAQHCIDVSWCCPVEHPGLVAGPRECRLGQ